ncbi:strawberry notch-like NTP hydrolase domain-containing protein [Kiloniella sp.]|uniref:strawberry notch-like NTP hydrolase domain-containing protein n=1 Tax=Kiloniella sp. TaxID=1938587 RepID=UPI003B0175FC
MSLVETQYAQAEVSRSTGILKAAQLLFEMMSREAICSSGLKSAMDAAFMCEEGWDGSWSFKDAYDALEVAQGYFVRKFGPAILAQSSSDALAMFSRLAASLPTQTKRSEEMVERQQFSTPLPLAYVVSKAAMIGSGDVVLEPSAGTGLLAIFGEVQGARLVLNELAETSRALLTAHFPAADVFGHNAEQIDDRLDEDIKPSVVLMNPPFSAQANSSRKSSDVTLSHLRSSLDRLCDGGRLVLVSGETFKPAGKWRGAFVKLQETCTLAGSLVLPSNTFAKHGTGFGVRLSIFDKVPAPDASAFTGFFESVSSLSEGLDVLVANLPARAAIERLQLHSVSGSGGGFSPSERADKSKPVLPTASIDAKEIELVFDLLGDDSQSVNTGDGNFLPWSCEQFAVAGAQDHVSQLCQSSAMASVKGPVPGYRPMLSERIVRGGLLSAAQLETVVYAGQAHSEMLEGTFSLMDGGQGIVATTADDPDGICYRQGYFLGDGTGAGKGRQIAGVFLDNWNRGRKRGIWISGSSALFEDARRDWSALGMDETQIVPLNRFGANSKLSLSEGILFTTFATLRSEGSKQSRIDQVINWLSRESGDQGFSGVIAFDEAHSMSNAVATDSGFGKGQSSAQGLAGLRLQFELPDARVIYASATAGTDISDLGYAERLGLWGNDARAFATRSNFISSMSEGGIAAMEVIARDLKSMGLYTSRVLSYDGVEVDPFVVDLSDAQTRMYNVFADAFESIHANLEDVIDMLSSGFSACSGRERGSALSVFESTKQRFFNAILTGMTGPKLILEIEKDLAAGNAPVLQLVSTAEAHLERCLSDIPVGEWHDLSINITPVNAVINYLESSFPVQVLEEYEIDGRAHMRKAVDEEGNPLISRKAVAQRDKLIEKIASLPSIPGILDQILHHFGEDMVAEVTGRSRRILYNGGKYFVSNRTASSNVSETQSFLDDQKRILVFSDAGGTGRSYHSGLEFKNQRRRVHYLVEPGWKADRAVQGLGRTKRTNQANEPVFRPVSTNVKGQRRFISTIARRLDALGAISRGQKQGGTSNFFKESDNLESVYAKQALRNFYKLLYVGKIDFVSIERFEKLTGLKLTCDEGLRDNLPPIQRFLNRILALRIEMQNQIFDVFDALHSGVIEQAKERGVYQVGVEALTADSLRIVSQEILREDEITGAETMLVQIERRDKREEIDVSDLVEKRGGKRVKNEKSGRVGILVPYSSVMDEDGVLQKRYKLHRPKETTTLYEVELLKSSWVDIDQFMFDEAWRREVADLGDYETLRFWMVTGLLLPLWKHLDKENPRVRRLSMDDGAQVLGRIVSSTEIRAMKSALGVSEKVDVSASELWSDVVCEGSLAALGNGFGVRHSRVGAANRVEITSGSGWEQSVKEQFYGLGCVSEIIQYKLRMFVPHKSVLDKILEKYGVQSVS